MIFGKQNSEIVQLAVANQSAIADGVVQYNYKTGELFGASFTTGTLENPNNPFIEVFRLPQGEMGEIDCNCNECPFRNEDVRYEGWEKLFPETRKECCMEAYIDNDFEDDFDDNFRESVEEQIRDVLSNHLGDTISKLNEIRIAISDRIASYDYFKVRTDNWEQNVLDTYVDSAFEDGFSTNGDPEGYLDAEVQSLANVRFREDEVEFWSKVGNLIEDHDFDGALEMLQ